MRQRIRRCCPGTVLTPLRPHPCSFVPLCRIRALRFFRAIHQSPITIHLGRVSAVALLWATLSAAPLAANAATLIVTNTNDNGLGSLRQALAGAQNGDIIQFDPALNGQ